MRTRLNIWCGILVLFNSVGCLITEPIWDSMIDSERYKYYGSFCAGLIRENKMSIFHALLGKTKNKIGVPDYCFDSTTVYTTDGTAPSALAYSASSFTFTQNAATTTQTPTVTGSVTSCSANPSLPTGLNLDATTCAISGTPTVTQPVTSHTITASNANGNTTTTLNITVNLAPPSALAYSASSFTFAQNATITTQTPTVTGSVTSCSANPSLPTGLNLDATTCAISGTPTVTQPVTSHTITASNANGNTTTTLNITVNLAPPSALAYSASSFTFTQNAAITTQTPTVTGTVTSCSANPSLPTGLNLDATTCAISGTPTVTQPVTSHTITASNANGNTTAIISITVNAPTFTIGGTVTGLTAGGLVLQNNAGDDLTVPSGAMSFTFATRVSGAYAVTVKTQPTGLVCSVSSGSGTASAAVSNVSVSCASSCVETSVTMNWGTFTDLCNGTVKFEGIAGTFGTAPYTYTAQTLYFTKCTHGQTYNAETNDCTGTGTAPDYYGAVRTQFCTTNDNSCNGDIATGVLTSGPTYNACNDLNLAGRSWRVPTKDEKRLLTKCTDNTMPTDSNLIVAGAVGCGNGNFTTPTILSMFTNSISSDYWTSTSEETTKARNLYLGSGSMNWSSKTSNRYVRCVSGP